jgi:LysM repeat protein
MQRARVAAALLSLCLLSASRVSMGATDAEGRQVHTVYPGQTLGKIAKRYGVSVEALCRVNRLHYGARIRPGQRLVVPNGDDDDGQPPAPRGSGNRWQDYSDLPVRRGFVVLESPTKKWRGFVLSRRGKPLPKAREAIERMFASWRTGTEHSIDDRLIKVVVEVSDTFGGRPIRVVSGYRERSFAVESKHKIGRAFDFSIPGVPNSAMRDYLRTLPRVGVGYYPNSTHVHVDVREESAYWVDESAPGEPPQYAHAGAKPGLDAPDESTPSPEQADDNRVE